MKNLPHETITKQIFRYLLNIPAYIDIHFEILYNQFIFVLRLGPCIQVISVFFCLIVQQTLRQSPHPLLPYGLFSGFVALLFLL